MPHLRLRVPDNTPEQRDVLPFPTGWSDAVRADRDSARRLAADMLDAERTARELDQSIEHLQRQLDELADEFDGALHMSDFQDWRPPAA